MRLPVGLAVVVVVAIAACSSDVLGQTVQIVPATTVEGPTEFVVLEDGQTVEAFTDDSATFQRSKTLFGQARLHYRPTAPSQTDKSLVGFLRRAFARKPSPGLVEMSSEALPVETVVRQMDGNSPVFVDTDSAARRVEALLRTEAPVPEMVAHPASVGHEETASTDWPGLPERLSESVPLHASEPAILARDTLQTVASEPATIILPYEELDTQPVEPVETMPVALTTHAPEPEQIVPDAPVPNPASPDIVETRAPASGSAAVVISSSVPPEPAARPIVDVLRPTSHTQAAPRTPVMTHADDYSWVQGKLYRVHVRGGVWVVRYASLDVTDRFGGSLVLARDRRVDNLREGDFVRVQGELLNDKSSVFLGGPLYRVLDVSLLQQASD